MTTTQTQNHLTPLAVYEYTDADTPSPMLSDAYNRFDREEWVSIAFPPITLTNLTVSTPALALFEETNGKFGVLACNIDYPVSVGGKYTLEHSVYDNYRVFSCREHAIKYIAKRTTLREFTTE